MVSFPQNDGDLYFVNFHKATGKSETINAKWCLCDDDLACHGGKMNSTLEESFQNCTVKYW